MIDENERQITEPGEVTIEGFNPNEGVVDFNTSQAPSQVMEEKTPVVAIGAAEKSTTESDAVETDIFVEQLKSELRRLQEIKAKQKELLRQAVEKSNFLRAQNESLSTGNTQLEEANENLSDQVKRLNEQVNDLKKQINRNLEEASSPTFRKTIAMVWALLSKKRMNDVLEQMESIERKFEEKRPEWTKDRSWQDLKFWQWKLRRKKQSVASSIPHAQIFSTPNEADTQVSDTTTATPIAPVEIEMSGEVSTEQIENAGVKAAQVLGFAHPTQVEQAMPFSLDDYNNFKSGSAHELVEDWNHSYLRSAVLARIQTIMDVEPKDQKSLDELEMIESRARIIKAAAEVRARKKPTDVSTTADEGVQGLVKEMTIAEAERTLVDILPKVNIDRETLKSYRLNINDKVKELVSSLKENADYPLTFENIKNLLIYVDFILELEKNMSSDVDGVDEEVRLILSVLQKHIEKGVSGKKAPLVSPPEHIAPPPVAETNINEKHLLILKRLFAERKSEFDNMEAGNRASFFERISNEVMDVERLFTHLEHYSNIVNEVSNPNTYQFLTDASKVGDRQKAMDFLLLLTNYSGESDGYFKQLSEADLSQSELKALFNKLNI